MCEDGATVAATPLPSAQLAVSFYRHRPDRQRSSMETFSVQQESPINYRKCPTFDAKRRRFSDFHSVWPSKTDETNETKNAAESENRLKNIRM